MKKIINSIIIASVLSTSAVAAEGKWTEGFGQGNLEYFIDKQDYRLYIGCPTQDGSAEMSSSVSLLKVSDSSEIESFTIKVDGLTFDGPFDANSRVGENNFIALLEALHKGNAIVQFGNKKITYPKSNAKKVIPLFGQKSFSCNLAV